MSVSINPNVAGSTISSTPVAYSPTLSSNTGVSGSTFLWHQEGQWMVIHGQILFNNSGPATALTFTLPSGTAIDTSILPGGTGTANATASNLGQGFWFDAGAGWVAIFPKYISTTAVGFWSNTQVFAHDLTANGDALNFWVKVPIAGW